MMSRWKKAVALASAVMMMGVFAGCGSQAEKPAAKADAKVELCVSAAASMTDAMKEIAQKYEKANPNIKITYSFGSSGALQSQIQEGAPADVFISAAQKQMNALADKDLINKDTRKDLLVNKVVLITKKDSKLQIADFKEVSGDKVKKIALGEPKGVPVGQYSEEVFKHLNILDAVKAKAVYGSDVRQVLAWVEAGEVDCGIVYATDAAISKEVKILMEAPEGSHKPVVYPIAVIKATKQADAAKAFVDFLSTQEVKDIFQKYGFATK